MGHQALVILVLGVPFPAHGGAEVEHVPDEGSPDIVALGDGLPVVVVQIGLLLLRVEPATGSGPDIYLVRRTVGRHVLADTGAATVLADAELVVREACVVVIHEGSEVGHGVIIPAEILVPGHRVRGVDERKLLVGRLDGHTPGIQAVSDVIEIAHDGIDPVVDLVLEAPEADGRVVVVLDDHLLKLESEVVFESLGGHIAAHERDFLPDDIAPLVRLAEHEVSLRIVGQAERIRTDLVEEIKVGQMVLLLEGGGEFRPILMAAYALQFQVLAVEEEALVGIHPEIAQADLFLDTVHFLAVLLEHGDCLVQVGILLAVPQVRTVQSDETGGDAVVDLGGLLLGHDLPGRIFQPESDFATLVVTQGRDVDLGAQFRTLLVHQFLVDQHTVGAEIERRDALRSGHLHPDVPVQAAVDVEVTALGCDVELRFVVADDSQAVRRTGTHIIGDLEDEGVISPPVLAHEAVVDQERGHHPRTFEAQEYALALVRRRDLELFGVGAIAAAVAAAAHEISSIPGVRQVDRLAGIGVRAAPAVHPGHTGRRETPVFVQRDDLACPGQVRGQEGGRKGDQQK